MSNDIKFSVIIPVYNRKTEVQRALESVFNQKHLADEIIVVNDGSDDGSENILDSYGDKIKVIHQHNKGVAAARNAGIQVAKNEWLAFLDSDDIWLPEKLELAEKFIRNNPNIKIFQAQEIWIRNGKRVNPKRSHQKYGGYIFKECLPQCIVSPSSVVIHKSVFSDVGLFDETLPVCEDYDLWLRTSWKYEIGLDEQFGIKKTGGHKDQLSTKYWGMDRFRIVALEKQLQNSELSNEQRQLVLQELVKKLNLLIRGYKKHKRDTEILTQKLLEYKAQITRH